MLRLRDYQEETLGAIAAAEQRGVRRQLVVLPTGAGKTVVFSHAIGRRLRDGQAVVLVHRDELAQQALAKLRNVNPGVSVGLVKAESNETGAHIIVASVQTLARENRRAQFIEAVPDIGVLVVDECHHVASDSYQTVLDDVGAFDGRGPLTLGFTATPERSDGKSLGATWQEVVYERSILDMIRSGYLCDIRGIRIALEGLDLAAVKRTGGDYQDGALGDALLGANAPEHAVAAYQEHAAGRKALLFTPTIQLAREMADAFRSAGIPAGWVSGDLPMDLRRDALARFRDGAVRVMCNAMVLTEGYDEPSVDCVIVARPTRAHALYVQQIGRGTRIYPDKSDLLVIDLVGASEDNKLQTVVDLVGRDQVPGKPREGQGLLEMVDEAEDERRHHGGKLRAEVVDLFGRSGFRWLPVGEMKWLLPLQKGSMLLARDGENWAVRLEQGRETAIQQIWAGSDVGYAQGAAEDWARRQGTSLLLERTARWLKDPASEKQRELLTKWRVPAPPELTKGEAADQLSLIFGKRAWGIRR